MATMYTWDADTGMYVPSDTGTFILNDAGAYVQSLSVTTDQSDYAPLSTATFTVGGVTAGDTLTFNVTDLIWKSGQRHGSTVDRDGQCRRDAADDVERRRGCGGSSVFPDSR